jgi:DNA-binding response OmpR family regulator
MGESLLEPAARKEAVTSGSMDALRVLVADDDAMSRTMVAALLRTEGYEVELAADGNEAWARLQNEGAPLAIIDWDMPGLDGIEVCRRLRLKKTLTPIYVILLTSRKAPDDVAAAFAAGADDYVIKPPRPHELLARVRVGSRVVALERQLAARTPARDAGIMN